MKTYGNLIQEITEEVAGGWKIGEPFPVLTSMQAISFKVILKAVFGLEEGDRYDRLKEVLLAILNPKRPIVSALLFLFPLLQKDLGAWSPWGRFLRQRQEMDELIYAEIKGLRKNPEPSRTDILSLMMAARYEDGESMSDEELRDELITLLVAGHETTATALAWALYWIHHLPEVREKLLQELATLGENPEPSEVAKLPYLNAVCQETLRIYPVAMLALNRLVKSPLEITGYQFQPGTLLIPNIYLTHHREDLYPNPKQFKPERFLSGQFAPYEFMPFGGGNRRCIGMAFAMYEMKLVLATVLSRWQMELADNKPVVPVRKGALLGPAKGVPMVVKKSRFQNQTIAQTASISA
jgi:unspecific monooxygenase